MKITEFLNWVKRQGWYHDQIVHVQRLPAQRARYGRLDRPLPRRLAHALRSTGVRRLYTHQAEAINALRDGENVILSTATASGKTLTYNLPGGWFGGYSDFDWIFDWENSGAATIPVGLQVGRVFSIGSMPFSLSVEGGYNMVRSSNFPEWVVGIELNWIFSGHSKVH